MPQLQKAMPPAAAPLRKFLRVVIYILPEKAAFPIWPVDCRQPVLDFFARHIAKPKPRGQ
jgi:hypothetical protein